MSTAACSILRAGALLALLGVAACEAPLRLEGVEANRAEPVKRYDTLQAAAATAEKLVVVSSAGAALVSSDGGESWQRDALPGAPSLIDVTACADGGIFALDSERRVWALTGDGTWQGESLPTPESTLSIHCAPGGRLWVTAGFATLLHRPVAGGAWTEDSLGDDLQFTRVKFVDAEHGFAVGEFGTVVASSDGGDSWDYLPPIPNDFYPMAADFLDRTTGWVGGLDGVIWETRDGGRQWTRQETGSATPVYRIEASDAGVVAVGGAGKYYEYVGGSWVKPANAPEVLAYFRAVELLGPGRILLAGAGGAMALLDRSMPARPNARRELASE
ncbi:MAG TPA: glycosyl hydrolase [Halieaceae bacterium]|nr:glycosyl hydrolase [Halieaceae bacterium]